MRLNNGTKRWMLVGATCSMLVLLATPGFAGAKAKVTRTAILMFQGTAGPGLDPIDNTYTCELQNLRVIYDGLFNETSDGAFQPVLATGYKLLANNVLQLSLRKDVKFQDNTPFNATAVKFNLTRAKTTKASTIAKSLTGLTSVTVVNPTTVNLTMAGPDASQLLVAMSTRAGMMASPTAVQSAGSESAFAQNPVGTGPYKFVSMSARQSLQVRKWSGYWNPKAQTLGGIDFTEVPFTSVISALQAGNEQWVSPQTVKTADTLKGNTTVKVLISPGTVYNVLVLNPTKAPFTNLMVRQAISYAITRQAVATTLESTGVKATYQEFSPGTPAYDPQLTKKPLYPYNPTKAKKLLSEAGFASGFTFTIVVGSSATLYVQQGEIIASQLAKVGVTMNVKTLTISTVFGMVYGKGGSVQGASYGGTTSVDPLAQFQSTFTPGGVTDAGNFTVPGVQTLVSQAAKQLTGPKRAKLFQQANDLVTKNVSNGVPLFFVPNINAIDKTVGGMTKAQLYCNTTFRGIYVTKK